MQTLDAQQLQEMKNTNQDHLLVNTLPADKFDQTRIEGAINIPQDQDDFVDQVAQQAGDKSKPIVVYCASESCNSSEKAAKKLDRAGFEHVYDFAGGAQQWQECCSN